MTDDIRDALGGVTLEEAMAGARRMCEMLQRWSWSHKELKRLMTEPSHENPTPVVP